VDAGVTVPDVRFRRPSRLLSVILPGVAALLALACWGLATLPFVLEPLATIPQIADDAVAKKRFEAAFVATDRLAPLRPGAFAPLTLGFSFALFGCLFAANAWMFPRLPRLVPVRGSTNTAAALLGVLGILLVVAALVALGFRPLLTTARLVGGRYGEGYDEDEIARTGIAVWWVLNGGVLLLVDVALLATVALASFRIGGAALLPPGQVVRVSVEGLSRIRFLGAVSLVCLVAYVVLLAVPPSTGPPSLANAWPGVARFVVVIVGVPVTWLFGLVVFEWVPRHLLADAQPASAPAARPQAIQTGTGVEQGIKQPEPDRG
jgi:hypothetical protein